MKKRIIYGAENMESRLAELLPTIDDDYEYLVSGLEKLDRSGKDQSDAGFEIAQKFYEMLQSAISEVSDLL